jgi:predicted ATPase
MRFHLPSFLLGAAAGASGAALAPRLRPLALELATSAYRVFDAVMLRVARGRENVSDLLAEARARARQLGTTRLHVAGASA